MKKAISFELGGKTACFRKPDVNQYAYFTYNNIHKPALLGLFGAILGYGGYTQLHNQNRDKKPNELEYNHGYPEFYERLKHLKISIVPLAPNGYFSKKIQVFNNSVGYASKEMGGNLIVREQWLENPKWQIIILYDESKEYEDLNKSLLERKAIFTPYLGKNDHIANIEKVKEIELDKIIRDARFSSLFIEHRCQVSGTKPRDEFSSWFKEISPITLQNEFHFYEYEPLVFTNHSIIASEHKDIYSNDEKNYFFI